MEQLAQIIDVLKKWEDEHPYMFSFALSFIVTAYMLFYTPSISLDEESLEQSERIRLINIQEIQAPQRVTRKDITESVEESTDYANVVRAAGTADEDTAVDLAFMPNIAPPRPVGKLKKRYPDQARQMDIEATVNVQLLIASNGRVKNVNILGIRLNKPLAPGKQRDITRKFARETVLILQGAQFTPPIVDGKKVPVRFEMPLRFRLED